MNRQELINNFILTLERERTKRGLTQTEMAKYLDISTSGYKKIISGETSKIDLTFVYSLYKLTGLFYFEMCGLSQEQPELDVIKKLMQLSPSQFRFIESTIDFELDFKAQEPEFEDYITVYTPTGDMEDGMIWDSCNIDKVNIASYRKKFGQDLHCGIRITSNHLHPVYHKNDILLINCRSPRDGDTGIFINKTSGRIYVRRLRQTYPCRLEPINNYGVVFEVNSTDEKEMDQWIKFGVVLTKMRG